MPKTIAIPKLSLVLLIGPAGSGKSTFAAKHFAPTEVLSSDRLRAMIDDDENSQAATNDAFEVLRLLASKRLARGRLTVIDATNARLEDRRPLLKLAQQYHTACIAIVLNVDRETCYARNEARSDRRALGRNVVDRQAAAIAKALPNLRREGFYRVITLQPADIDELTLRRERMRPDRCDERGPFDIIGDVHGCCDELEQLLAQCGYARGDDGVWRHPEGRRAIFLGDLIDRGPRSVDTLRLVMAMVEAGAAHCLPGNHENLLLSWFKGKTMSPAHGLRQTIGELDNIPQAEYGAFKKRCAQFLGGLESHLILDGGRLVVAHAGMTADLVGRIGVRHFALYGETRGELDGFARRKAPLWAQRYREKARVIYGHVAVETPKRVHNTLNIDTGCVFGGKLTALRYPEGDIVSVPAARVYFEPAFPPTKGGEEAPPSEQEQPMTAEAAQELNEEPAVDELTAEPAPLPEEPVAEAAPPPAPMEEPAAPLPPSDASVPSDVSAPSVPPCDAQPPTPNP